MINALSIVESLLYDIKIIWNKTWRGRAYYHLPFFLHSGNCLVIQWFIIFIGQIHKKKLLLFYLELHSILTDFIIAEIGLFLYFFHYKDINQINHE